MLLCSHWCRVKKLQNVIQSIFSLFSWIFDQKNTRMSIIILKLDQATQHQEEEESHQIVGKDKHNMRPRSHMTDHEHCQTEA